MATAPDAAVALGEVAPAAPETDDSAAPAIPPDPSAGEVEPAAGRLKTAEGTPEPIAPLRTPDADLSAAASIADPAPDTAAAVSPSATPSAEPAAAPASSSPLPSSSPEPAAAAAAAAPPTERTFQTEEPEAIDLLAVAGSSIYKRVIPVAIGAVVVAAVIVWFVARG